MPKKHAARASTRKRKVKVEASESYAQCLMFTTDPDGLVCPLCGTEVPPNVWHWCSIPEGAKQ